MTEARNALIYCRISDDATSERAGVERQRKDCEKFCAEQGWFVVKVLTDNDFSASRYAKKQRPGYTEAIQMLKGGQANTIVAWDMDRLWRQPRELEDLIDLADPVKSPHPIKVSSIYGDLRLEDGDGRFNARQLVNMAAKSSDDTSRRVRRVREDEARNGIAHAGGRSYGYTAGKSPEIVKDEARLLRAAAKRVLAGASISAICREWNEKGVATARGGQWLPTTLRQMLVNPKYAGLRSHHGEVVSTGTWKPIFDRETHEKLVRVLSAGRRKVPLPQNYSLLTGLVRCGQCDCTLVKDTGKLRCKAVVGRRNCGKIVTVYDKTEAEIVARVLDALDGPTLDSARIGRDVPDDDNTAIVFELEAALTDLASDFGQGLITRGEWLAARKGLEERLDAARARLVRMDRIAALDGITNIRKQWDGLSLDRQRGIIAAVTVRIAVNPATKLGRFYDPNRVVVEWRI